MTSTSEPPFQVLPVRVLFAPVSAFALAQARVMRGNGMSPRRAAPRPVRGG